MTLRMTLLSALTALILATSAAATGGTTALSDGEEQIPGLHTRPIAKAHAGPPAALTGAQGPRVFVLPATEGRTRDTLVIETSGAPGDTLVLWIVLDGAVAVPLGHHVLDAESTVILPAPPAALRDRLELVVIQLGD